MQHLSIVFQPPNTVIQSGQRNEHKSGSNNKKNNLLTRECPNVTQCNKQRTIIFTQKLDQVPTKIVTFRDSFSFKNSQSLLRIGQLTGKSEAKPLIFDKK